MNPIQQFLRSFEAGSAAGEVAAIVSHFAETFVAANPAGAQMVRAGDFALAIPKRFELFRKFGCKAAELETIEELDSTSRFAIVRTRWRMVFEHEGAMARYAHADSIYVIDTGVTPFQIVFYLAKQDPMQLLQSHGTVHG